MYYIYLVNAFFNYYLYLFIILMYTLGFKSLLQFLQKIMFWWSIQLAWFSQINYVKKNIIDLQIVENLTYNM